MSRNSRVGAAPAAVVVPPAAAAEEPPAAAAAPPAAAAAAPLAAAARQNYKNFNTLHNVFVKCMVPFEANERTLRVRDGAERQTKRKDK